jgi:hypothetical protein
MSAPTSSSVCYLTIEDAAALLSLSAVALRARCRRASRRRGRDVVAELGDGIAAVKFGRSWRVRVPTLPTSIAA